MVNLGSLLGVDVSERVLQRCGSGSQFDRLSYAFGDWLEFGRGAPRATVELVEPALAAYLDQAARVGRIYGSLRGAVLGVVVSVPIAGIAAAFAVFA